MEFYIEAGKQKVTKVLESRKFASFFDKISTFSRSMAWEDDVFSSTIIDSITADIFNIIFISEF